MNREPPSWKSWFEHFFLSYGAGRGIFTPVRGWRLWHWLSWFLIVVGIIGWIVLLLYINPETD